MAKLRPVQNSFSAGEISPLLNMRSDSEGYRYGVAEMLNMLPTPQGPATSRKGFNFARDFVGETTGRLFPIRVGLDQAYIITITPNSIYVSDEAGGTPSVNYFQNPSFELGSANWNPVAIGQGNVSFPSGTCVLTSGNNATHSALISQEVTALTATNQHTLRITFRNSDQVRILIQTADDLVGDISDELHSGLNYSVSFTPGVGTFRVKVIKEGGTNTSKTIDDMVLFDIITGEVVFTSPYNDLELQELQYAQVPGQQMVYFVTRDVEPYRMVFSAGVWVWEIIPFDFGAGSAPWGADFPGALTFHDGRLWLGGSRIKPVTHWASAIDEATSDFTNFDPAFDSGTGDAAVLDFTRSKDGDIRWLAASRELFSGASIGEDLITSSAGAITTTDVQMERQSVRGSARIQPRSLSDRLVFIEASGNVLYAMDFLDGRKGWSSVDISFASEHLLKSGVTELSEIKTPTSGSLITRSDGKLVVVVYDTIRDIVGWTLLETNGTIISATVAERRGASFYVILVKRTNGLFAEYISVGEVKPQTSAITANNGVYIDSAKEATSVTPTATFPGFEHLANEEVTVIADGTVHHHVIVDASGLLTLDDVFTQVFAGYPYTARLKTLPQDVPTTTGSGRSMMNHWAKLYVRVLNSGEPKINGTRPPTRQVSTPMGDTDPLITGDLKVADLGTTRDGIVTIEQDLPFPLTIVGIFGEVGNTGL